VPVLLCRTLFCTALPAPFYLLPIVETAAFSAAGMTANEVKSGYLARVLLHLIERYLFSDFLRRDASF